MSDRLTLALPIDVFLDHFDATVTQTQLSNNTVLGSPDDRDVLSSMLEGAEDEFRQRADMNMRLSRVGSPGSIETYEEVTYDVKGHEAFKRNWARTARDYMPAEAETDLKNDRVLPFDSAEGDEVHVYRGLRGSSGNSWEDVTSDQGDLWDIVDYRGGTFVIHPAEVHRAMVGHAQGVGGFGGQLRQARFRISYRHGGLGGGRGTAGQTTLSADLNSTTDTPNSLSVDDASRLPASNGVVLLMGEEYLLADVDATNDALDVLKRGVRNTTAESHASGDRVVYTPGAIRKAVAARAAMQVVDAGRYQSFLPDTDDTIDKGEMKSDFEATWDATLEAMS